MIDTYIIKNSFDAMTEKSKIAIQKKNTAAERVSHISKI
jgi:hypothetical protein